MPQIFQVLKCFKCSVFQVHQTKKSNKWECKLCGEKQSMKRHYGLGTGKECRLHVQKLNSLRGDLEEINDTAKLHDTTDEDDSIENDKKIPDKKIQNYSSKWLDFVDKDVQEPVPVPKEPMLLGNAEVVLEVPVKKRKFTKPRTIGEVSKSKPSNSKDYFADHRNIRKSPSPPPMILYETETKVLNTDECELVHANVATSKTMGKRTTISDFVPHKVNKYSKWAQYADIDEDNEKSDNDNFKTNNENEQTDVIVDSTIGNRENPSKELSINMFALCDEKDLDDVLDF